MTNKKKPVVNFFKFTFHSLPVKGNFVLIKNYATELNGKLGIVTNVNGGYFHVTLLNSDKRIVEVYENEMTIVEKYLWFANEK